MNLLLENARVVLPDQILETACVSIESGLIAAVTTLERASSINESLDLSGLTLLPGFIDVHIHGACGFDTMEATPEQLRQIAVYLASQGVTGWLPTFVPAADEDYVKAARSVDQSLEDNSSGARVFGVHYEGPFVNSSQCGALHAEYFKTYSAPRDLDCLCVPERAGLVRMITLAPEIGGGVELVRELKQRGWVISIGHTRADLEDLDRAFAAGARHMTHFMNAMSPLHHRSPGPVAWGLARDDVTCDVIADGVHLHPFVLRLLLEVKGARGISLISDAIAAAGKGDGDYKIWGETITVQNGRTSNAAGSIAGSVITMLDAVRFLRALGVSYVDLAWMAAANPARLLGLDRDCGSIEVGKRADLVALDEQGNVRLTLIGGQVAYDSSS